MISKSLYMRPSLPAVDAPYSGFPDPIFFGYSSLFTSPRNLLADGNYIFFCKHRPAMSFAKKINSAAFFNHISDILGLCSKPQVGWVYTSGVVTGMANTRLFWHRAYKKLIGYSVGFAHFAIKEKLSVSMLIRACLPRPASISNRNFAHKPVVRRVHINGLLRDCANSPCYQGIGVK